MLVTDPQTRTIYINDERVTLDEQATVRDAIRVYDRRYMTALERDTAEVMDEQGWPLPLDAPATVSDRIYVCVLPWEEEADST